MAPKMMLYGGYLPASAIFIDTDLVGADRQHPLLENPVGLENPVILENPVGLENTVILDENPVILENPVIIDEDYSPCSGCIDCAGLPHDVGLADTIEEEVFPTVEAVEPPGSDDDDDDECISVPFLYRTLHFEKDEVEAHFGMEFSGEQMLSMEQLMHDHLTVLEDAMEANVSHFRAARNRAALGLEPDEEPLPQVASSLNDPMPQVASSSNDPMVALPSASTVHSFNIVINHGSGQNFSLNVQSNWSNLTIL